MDNNSSDSEIKMSDINSECENTNVLECDKIQNIQEKETCNEINSSVVGESPSNDDKEKSEDEWLDIMGSGNFKKKVIKPGLGIATRPNRGDRVTVSVAFHQNGITFDENENLNFIVGDLDVIQALDLVICLMEKGEKAKVLIPSKLAYGKIGRLPEVPPDCDLECDIELKEVEAVDTESLTVSERLQLGNEKRARGNRLYERGEYLDAIHCYERAIEYLDGVRDCSNSSNEELQEVVDTRVKVYNNITAAHLKLNAYPAALKAVESVLKVQPQNVKALFRKSKILGIQGLVDEAITYMAAAAMIEPETKIIQMELAKFKNQKKREEETQKAMYQRMFKSEPKKSDSFSWMKKWRMITCGVLAVAVGSAVAYKQYHM